MTIRCGIIGLGRVGRLYRGLLEENPTFWQLTATADPNTEADYRDYRQLLATNLDAVLIATPPHTHYDIARDALKAGKDVLVEKPPAGSVAACEELVALAAAHERVLFFAYHARYNWAVEETRRMVAGERIAHVSAVYKENAFRYHDHDSWVFGEGVLRDSGINAISVIAALLPEATPLRVASATLVRSSDLNGAFTSGVLDLLIGASATARVEMDWRHLGDEIRQIDVRTNAHGYRLDVVTDALYHDGISVERTARGGGQLRGEYCRMLAEFTRRLAKRESLTSTVEVDVVETAHRIAAIREERS